MLGGGRVFYRSGDAVHMTSRDEFAELAQRGEITSDTCVFDVSITSAEAWRSTFERRARDAWTASLLKA